MTATRILRTRRTLTTPRAAAVAGILFALLFGAAVILIRLSVSVEFVTGREELLSGARPVTLALNLLPYSGIAFLWFIGVIRDRLGEIEDRFFATVFLGSGLTFLGLVFAAGALTGGMLSTLELQADAAMRSGVLLYGRITAFQLLNIYAIRMAGVFMISLATIWLRSGLMHRGWALATYALALVLLLSIGVYAWVLLIFPGWVFAVSLYYLVANLRNTAREGVQPG